MALSQFSFLAKTVQEMQAWFIDIYNHLSAKNYDNGAYVASVSGVTGDPVIVTRFQRFGKICTLIVTIVGTHSFSDGEITLPLVATGEGAAVIQSVTNGSFLGFATVDSTAQRLLIKRYWVTDETVVIVGTYSIAGI